MNVLVTAGNTRAFIDQVRCLTNIFTGRTGAAIALEALGRGHRVTLLTSRPEAVAELTRDPIVAPDRWQLLAYDTLEDLRILMANHLENEEIDAVVHSAAVSDYLAAGVYAPAPGTTLTKRCTWQGNGGAPTFIDR